jgi:hypothetical protein
VNAHIHPRRRWLWRFVPLLVLAVSAVACSVEERLSAPYCDNGSTILIVTQSVPTAELVPCLNPLPTGWSVATISVDQAGTVIRMDSDRAGTHAATLRFADSCDVGDAVDATSDQQGAERFEFIGRIEPGLRAERYYTFPGGCVWWSFDFDDDTPAALAIELGDTLTLQSRQAIIDSVGESFIKEDF